MIGQPHPTGRPALRMLEEEGFYFDRYIDIFDGGPTVIADTDEIRSVREASVETVCEIGEPGRNKMILAAGRLAADETMHYTLLQNAMGRPLPAGALFFGA